MKIDYTKQLHRPHHSWKVKNTSKLRALRENYIYPTLFVLLFGSVVVNLLIDVSKGM